MDDDADAQAPGQAPFLSGDGYFLWTFTTPAGVEVPLGIASEEAPSGLVGISSHNVGRSRLAQLGAEASEATATVYHGLNQATKFDKLLKRLVP